MNNKYSHINGFTLIEIIVTIAIISIVMVSVIATFVAVQQVTRTSDIHRSMQENVKSIMERISTDIAQSWIQGVSEDITDPYGFAASGYKQWTGLQTGSNRYYLAQQDLQWDWIRVTSSVCQDIQNNCSLFMKDKWPLTNSRVSVQDITWYVSEHPLPKVTLVLQLQPATKKWISSEIALRNTQVFQTTFAQRLLNQ